MNTKVLYVEDEEDFQMLVERILSRAGLDVILAESAQEAYRLMERETPGALLLDINLPDSTGYDICTRVRKDSRWTELPIVMLTVRRKPEEWLRGFSCGANDYLSKPIQPKELVERLLKSLQRNGGGNADNGSAEFKLVRAIVAGNRTGFHVLVEKYRKRLAESLNQYIHNETQMEDVISHAFATALECLHEFRGESSFFTWLYRIAMNEFIAMCRKPHTVPLEDVMGDQESRIHWSSYPDEAAEEASRVRQDMSQKVMKTLAHMPAPYKETLELYCLKDLSYEAISHRLQIPEGTVMSRLHKGRKLLQEAWSKSLQ